mgnify:FL=1
MNVGELKKLLEDVSDDVQIICDVGMEMGRGGQGGKDTDPSFTVYTPGECERRVDSEDLDDVNWYQSEDDTTNFLNKSTVLEINVSPEEEWED